MIVVPIELWSAISKEKTTLGTLVIDNISGGGPKRDYRVRMYKKSKKTLVEQHRTEKPIREAKVLQHRAEAEPVQNLVAKALKQLGYKED